MDWLQAIPWGTLTPGMLLALVVLLIVRGELHPHREVVALRQELDLVRRERDDWKSATLTLLTATESNAESASRAANVLTAIESRLTTQTPPS